MQHCPSTKEGTILRFVSSEKASEYLCVGFF